MSSDSEDSGESGSQSTSCLPPALASQESRLRSFVSSGVKFQDPNTTYVGDDVEIESGAWIGAGCHILGASFIGAYCRLGPSSIVEDSKAGSGSVVESFCSVIGSELRSNVLVKARSEVRNSIIGSGAEIGSNAIVEFSEVEHTAKVGPFCRVRSGSVVCSYAYVGTHAEVKSSRIGEYSKVGHFSFTGDAELGSRVNIGAGTVTANYDGESVQKTVIEDDASIGVLCALIAPVRIGAGARAGAGAVVTRDVSAGELVVGVPARLMIRGV